LISEQCRSSWLSGGTQMDGRNLSLGNAAASSTSERSAPPSAPLAEIISTRNFAASSMSSLATRTSRRLVSSCCMGDPSVVAPAYCLLREKQPG
jgi:hypothetical protein